MRLGYYFKPTCDLHMIFFMSAGPSLRVIYCYSRARPTLRFFAGRILKSNSVEFEFDAV